MGMASRKIFAAVAALIGWFALVLQFVLLVWAAPPDVPAGELVIRFFSFFTILTNILIAVVLTAEALTIRSNLTARLTSPSMMTASAVYITVVGVVYSLFLRSVWQPTGWHAVVDHSLHDVTPVMFVIFWLVFTEKSSLKWLDAFKWLVYPAAYLIYSIVRGSIVNWYPYWFADVTKLGYPQVLFNAAMVMAGFVFVGIIFIAVGKVLSRTANTAAN